MKSLWNDGDARQHRSPRAMRVYTSRLLGSDPNLVLHGGGNTSVKETSSDEAGNPQQILFVKGSGWDLGSIEEAGFAPVKMEPLLAMAELDDLSDADMVAAQRAAMTDPSAPNPSIEAILHALIPFTYVDHSHADAVVTITNTPDGEQLIREALGERVLIVPYVMPGFILAKTIYEMTRETDWQALEGIVLMNHGLFTFAGDARSSYEQHIELVTRAEDFLRQRGAVADTPARPAETDLLALARIRKAVAARKGQAVLARLNNTDLAMAFSGQDLSRVPRPGPLTPEHVIRTKAFGAVLDEQADRVEQQLDEFQRSYEQYFQEHAGTQKCLNSAPNYAIWKDVGSIAFGKSSKETAIIEDLNQHTFEAILRAGKLGGYQALSDAHLFDIEYWELEQAKLKKAGAAPALSGRVVVIAESDSEFRQICADRLGALGAEVCLVGSEPADSVVAEVVRRCGGIDILLLNLQLPDADVLLGSADAFLREGIEPVMICLNGSGDRKSEDSKVRVNYLRNYQQAPAEAAAALTVELIARTALNGVSIDF